MSSSDFDDRSRLCSRMFYQPPNARSTLALADFSGSLRTGPDVTLATSSNFAARVPQQHSGQESPDLVSAAIPGPVEMVEGATALCEPPAWSPSATTSSMLSIPRMSHSYCTGSSHMYL